MKYQSLLGLSSCLAFLVASRRFFGPDYLCSPCIYHVFAHVFAHVFIVYIHSVFHFLDFVALCVFVKISGPKLEGLTPAHWYPISDPCRGQVSLCRCSGRHQGRNLLVVEVSTGKHRGLNIGYRYTMVYPTFYGDHDDKPGELGAAYFRTPGPPDLPWEDARLQGL